MSMKAFPFTSEVTYDTSGFPEFDRAVDSQVLRRCLKNYYNNGVFATNSSTCFQVTAPTDSSLGVVVQAGVGLINGATSYDDSATTISLDKADTVLPRIDTIVLRLNDNTDYRRIYLDKITGTPATTPAAPALTQSDSIYDLGLANVYVAANVTVISQSNITDTRADSTRCGYVTAITKLDTSTLMAQLNTYYDEFVAKCTSDYNTSRADYLAQCQEIVKTLTAFESTSESDFNAWFAAMKGQLSTDAAGKIQLEIDAITEKEFLDVYGLCTKTTSIDKTDGVTTNITESDSSSSTNTITAVTTFTRSSSGETTQIQTVVTPTSGNYYYTKTVAFATTTTGKTITESYTKTAKS